MILIIVQTFTSMNGEVVRVVLPAFVMHFRSARMQDNWTLSKTCKAKDP